MKSEIKSTYITSVDDLFKFYVMGSGDELYISNLISPEIVECFKPMLSEDIKIIYFDYREFAGPEYTPLKRNGKVEYKLNNKIVIYKQKYYYYSKGQKKYKTTMLPNFIDKHSNYTRKTKNHRIMQSKIFYVSYENTAEELNELENINISRQTVYLHEREVLRTYLPNKESELWEKIRKLGIKAIGYYHYDEVRQDRAFSPIKSVKFPNVENFNPCCLGFPPSKFLNW